MLHWDLITCLLDLFFLSSAWSMPLPVLVHD
jgi:hypothetical protein